MPRAQIQRRDDPDRDAAGGIRPEGKLLKPWALLLLLCAGLLSGCAALMMSGDGGYKPPADCTAEQRAAGLCKTR